MSFSGIEKKMYKDLLEKGADFVHFIDLASLSSQQTRGFPYAILIGIALTKQFVKMVASTPNYVEEKIRNQDFSKDEYISTELRANALADYCEAKLINEGYLAVSQSEKSNEREGSFNPENMTSILPHKTIATLSGIGWIGRNNLLITESYGCAICMCTILTTAPASGVCSNPKMPLCGSCYTCIEVCPTNALSGVIWSSKISRDEILDVAKCNTCLKCLIHCPWTQKYMNST